METDLQQPSNDPTAAVSRRSAITAMTAAACTAPLPAPHVGSLDDRVVVGVMGLSRGMSLAKNFAAIPGVEVRYLCDVDRKRLNAGMKALSGTTDTELKAVTNFEEILEDPDVTALVCAAPNHWHAPAGILACAAGKHVYVEKPCSHNPQEGEWLVAAARKHNRCVQMGNQRRSNPAHQEAVSMLRDGAIGDVIYSRSWYANLRGTIGTGQTATPPETLDYSLWQGPAPQQPFTSNRLHYNWHWNWMYGNGELGNNGVHSIDLSRWGLDVDYPIRVVSSGGRYFFDDDQQTPDTHMVSFEFSDGRQIIWEGLSCNRMGMDGSSFGASFHGTNGSLKMSSWGFELFDRNGRPQHQREGSAADLIHIQNFVDAVREGDPRKLNSEIEEGHKSTLLCHLGNIAQRTRVALNCRSTDGHIIDQEDAAALWEREYAAGWRIRLSEA